MFVVMIVWYDVTNGMNGAWISSLEEIEDHKFYTSTNYITDMINDLQSTLDFIAVYN